VKLVGTPMKNNEYGIFTARLQIVSNFFYLHETPKAPLDADGVVSQIFFVYTKRQKRHWMSTALTLKQDGQT
jgi:hypothetical protein